MKKLITMIAVIIIIPMMAQAQGKFTPVIEKWQGKDGITTINITGDMFETLGEMEGKEIPEGVEGMIILTCDNDDNTDGSVPSKIIYEEIKAIIDKENYKVMMDINDGDEHVHFLIRKDESKKKLSEFLMLVTEEDETTFIWMGGELDFDDIKQIQKMQDMDDMFEKEDDHEHEEEEAEKGQKVK